MHLSIKLVTAAVLWSASVSLALYRTIDGNQSATVWAVLVGLVAAMISSWLVLDIVTERVAKTATRLVERGHEQMTERVASKITSALRDGGGSVSPLR